MNTKPRSSTTRDTYDTKAATAIRRSVAELVNLTDAELRARLPHARIGTGYSMEYDGGTRAEIILTRKLS